MVRKVKTESDENKTVGEILKDARLAAKLSVEKVSDKTRIGADYLIAIEAGDFNALPGQVYASGFVRTYAKFLGLDAGEIYDKFTLPLPKSGNPPASWCKRAILPWECSSVLSA